ncbi:hypothetical protein B0H16DRAFT_1562497 [Mycena metata]|uniref:Uncharacterized protein n=1 Tax=Mycena metata TaxID=1033252 RepID=A0AAD7N2G0_9AGAR|nr:hypothetical protein B0H16DRAFT_1562497 [Mycena metata]
MSWASGCSGNTAPCAASTAPGRPPHHSSGMLRDRTPMRCVIPCGPATRTAANAAAAQPHSACAPAVVHGHYTSYTIAFTPPPLRTGPVRGSAIWRRGGASSCRRGGYTRRLFCAGSTGRTTCGFLWVVYGLVRSPTIYVQPYAGRNAWRGPSSASGTCTVWDGASGPRHPFACVMYAVARRDTVPATHIPRVPAEGAYRSISARGSAQCTL